MKKINSAITKTLVNQLLKFSVKLLADVTITESKKKVYSKP